MLYDELSSLGTYGSLVHDLPLVVAILKARPWEVEGFGTHKTENPRITYTVLSYESSSVPTPYEVYKEKTQLHVILEGEELMALSWREHARSAVWDSAGKATLSGDPIGVIHAKSGHFALFMPGEPHTVGMESSKEHNKVTKVLFSIAD